MKQTLSLTVALVLTVAGFTYALWDVDTAELYSLLKKGRYGYALPVLLALLSVHFWLKATRWTVLLKPLGQFLPRQVLPVILIGFAGNNLLPAHLGELVRVVVFSRRFEQSMASVFVTQVLERIFDVLAILLYYAAALAFADYLPERLMNVVWIVTIAIAGIISVVCFVLIFPTNTLKLWQLVSSRMPEFLRHKGESTLISIINALSSLRSSVTMLTLLANSLLQWGAMLGIIWISLWAYGSSASVTAIVTLLAVLSLAVALPSSPGYVGATQAAFVFALTYFAIDKEIAFAASVFFLVAQWVPVTLIGVGYFFYYGLDTSIVRSKIRPS